MHFREGMQIRNFLRSLPETKGWIAHDNPDAPASAQHDSWLEEKQRDGWIWGDTKDADKKTHPCIVPYRENQHRRQNESLKMAYVPDDIEAVLFDLPARAVQIYFFACKWRDHKTGTFRRDLSELRRIMPRSTFYRCLTELKEKNLIRTDGDEILWIAGDFSPMEKKGNPKNETEKTEDNFNNVNNSLKNGTDNPKNGTMRPDAPEFETSGVSKMRQNCPKNGTHPPTTPKRNNFKFNQQPALEREHSTYVSETETKSALSLAGADAPSDLIRGRPERLPADWALPDEGREWFERMSFTVSIELETEKFRNHFAGLPSTDPKAFSENWLAVWKNWILRGQEYEMKTRGNTRKNGEFESNTPPGFSRREQKKLGEIARREQIRARVEERKRKRRVS